MAFMKQSHWGPRNLEIWLLIYWQVWKISKISLYYKVRTCNYCLSLVKSQSTSNVNAVVSATDSVDLEIAPSKSEEEHFDQLHPEVQIYWQFCLTDNKLKIFFCTIESGRPNWYDLEIELKMRTWKGWQYFIFFRSFIWKWGFRWGADLILDLRENWEI